MAGSWQHMTTPKGKLRSNTTFVQMIENLGDAYETAEDCYGMVWWLANSLARETAEFEITRDKLLNLIQTAAEHSKDGLSIGGVQRER